MYVFLKNLPLGAGHAEILMNAKRVNSLHKRKSKYDMRVQIIQIKKTLNKASENKSAVL